MELSLSHTLHLFNIFREYDEKDNCAQVLEEEISKMFGTKYLNDECRCQNRRISGRGSRTVRLGRMVTGGKGHEVLPRFGPSRWR